MKYQDLLENIAIYGRGVFTISMTPKSEHQNFRKFINRNPQLFLEIKGNRGHKKICVLTRKGTKYLGLINCNLSSSQEFATLLDIATINAYMADLEKFCDYQMTPQQPITIDGKKVGVISPRWGLPHSPVEILISSPSMAKKFFPGLLPSNLIIPRGVQRL